MQLFSPECFYLWKIYFGSPNPTKDRPTPFGEYQVISDTNWWFVNRDYSLTQKLLDTGYLSHFGNWEDNPASLVTAKAHKFWLDVACDPWNTIDIAPMSTWPSYFRKEFTDLDFDIVKTTPSVGLLQTNCLVEETQWPRTYSVSERGRELVNLLLHHEEPAPLIILPENIISDESLIVEPPSVPLEEARFLVHQEVVSTNPLRIQERITVEVPEVRPEPATASAASTALVAVIATDDSNVRCPYCFDEDSALETIKCDFCRAVQHKECYREYGKCVTCKRSIAALAIRVEQPLATPMITPANAAMTIFSVVVIVITLMLILV